MNIKELGEFGFIDAVKDNTLFNPGPVVIGIGDDGAVYKTTDGMEQVAVIDTMVENSHFIIGKTSTWYDAGYKAVASNLSDIAAMGAVPTHIILSTAIAPDMDSAELIELYRGIKDICRKYKVNILGGDTVMSKEGMVITVAAFGEVEAGKAVRRSGAQAGDIVAVSHTLGDSGAGLDVFLHGADGFSRLKKAHALPEPQIELGRLLVKHCCHSLNDISDGLASESNEIAKASRVDLILQKERIPLSDELRHWAKLADKDPYAYALTGGEDYELVFTLRPDDFTALQRDCDYVTPIGTVEAGNGTVWLETDGVRNVLPPVGWTHFSEEA